MGKTTQSDRSDLFAEEKTSAENEKILTLS